MSKINWNNAPEGTTHAHSQTGMFYKVEGTTVLVYGENGWGKSRVQAGASTLVEIPKQKAEPMVKTIEATSKEDLVRQLKSLGLPDALIQAMVGMVEEDEEPTSHHVRAPESISEKEAEMVTDHLEIAFNALPKFERADEETKDVLIDFGVDLVRELWAMGWEPVQPKESMNDDELAEVIKQVSELLIRKTNAPVKATLGSVTFILAALRELGHI